MKEFNVNLQCEFPDEYDTEAVLDYIRILNLGKMDMKIAHAYIFDMDTRRGKGGNVAWPNVVGKKDGS